VIERWGRLCKPSKFQKIVTEQWKSVFTDFSMLRTGLTCLRSSAGK
jgi:hypothetical protein